MPFQGTNQKATWAGHLGTSLGTFSEHGPRTVTGHRAGCQSQILLRSRYDDHVPVPFELESVFAASQHGVLLLGHGRSGQLTEFGKVRPGDTDAHSEVADLKQLTEDSDRDD